jgi:hypothetical protein
VWKLLGPPLLCVACGGLGLLSWLWRLELLVRPVLRASLSLLAGGVVAWRLLCVFLFTTASRLARVGVRGPVSYAPIAFIGSAPQQAEQR